MGDDAGGYPVAALQAGLACLRGNAEKNRQAAEKAFGQERSCLMSPLILSIDQGTTGTPAILFDTAGNICRVSQKELRLSYPQNGWVEQDPRDIWADTQ